MFAQPLSDTAQTYFECTDSDYFPEDSDVRFRLTYEGELKATGNRSNPRHAHEIRRVFHGQLRQFWLTHPYLKEALWSHPQTGFHKPHKPLRHHLAEQHQRHDHYNFVPLVTEELSLACGLDILFMRPSMPGAIMKSGDIDGRMKTIFDALKMPKCKSWLGGYATSNAYTENRNGAGWAMALGVDGFSESAIKWIAEHERGESR